MAVVFTEGFDYYNGITASTSTSVGVLSRWIMDAGGNASLIAGRFGGQALQPLDPNDPMSAQMPSTYNSGCIGFAINPNAGYAGSDYGTLAVSTSAVNVGFNLAMPQFYINLNSGFQVQVRRPAYPSASVLLATSTAALTPSVWNYLEIEFVISDTVGEVRVYLNSDPTPIINISGVDNKAQAASGFSYIVICSIAGVATSANAFDDIYVTDTPTRLGEQRVVTSYPTSDVLTAFWSSSTGGAAPYTMIDETTCDADVTYVSSNTFNSRLVVGMPTLPVVPVNVNAVQIVGFARKDETQFRQLALEYENTAGAVSTGSTYTLSGNYTRMQNLYIENPLTGAPWTATDVNSMKIGARVVS